MFIYFMNSVVKYSLVLERQKFINVLYYNYAYTATPALIKLSLEIAHILDCLGGVAYTTAELVVLVRIQVRFVLSLSIFYV